MASRPTQLPARTGALAAYFALTDHRKVGVSLWAGGKLNEPVS